MKKIIILILFIGTLSPCMAVVIQSSHIVNGVRHRNANQWKAAYNSRGLALLGETPTVFFTRIANSAYRLTQIKTDLESIFVPLRDAHIAAGKSPVYAFNEPLIKIDKNKYGLSQFVLESALACGFFPSSNALKVAGVCRGYPKLAIAMLMLIKEQLPSRGIRYVNFADIASDTVDHARALVLTRALIPIYMAYKINNRTVASGWYSSRKRLFNAKFLELESELNSALKDFYVHIILTKYGNNSTNFTDVMNRYRSGSAVNLCIEKRSSFGGPQRCTSNHAMVAYLGRLMMASVAGRSLSGSLTEFKKLITHGISYRSGKYHFSDIYRTHILKTVDGVRVNEKKGYSYSLLQARTLVIASEIFLNSGQVNLYNYNNSRLKKALDFLAEIGTKKKYRGSDTDSIYFTSANYLDYVDGNRGASYNSFKNRFLFDTEYTSYVVPRANWARNYGFFLMASKRVCVNDTERTNNSFLCKTSSEFNSSTYQRNTIPFKTNKFSSIKESVNVGPVQLLFYNLR